MNKANPNISWRHKTKLLAGLWILSMVIMMYCDLYADWRGNMGILAAIGWLYSCFALASHISKRPQPYMFSREIIWSMVIVSLFVISILCVWGLHTWHEYRLNHNGLTGRAVITSKYKNSRRNGTIYTIKFMLQTENEILDLDESVPGEVWNSKYNIGDTIDVLYLPTNPGNHRLLE